jgi:hypothetical protein
MPRAGFEPTITVFERLKTVCGLHGRATGTGHYIYLNLYTEHFMGVTNNSRKLYYVMKTIKHYQARASKRYIFLQDERTPCVMLYTRIVINEFIHLSIPTNLNILVMYPKFISENTSSKLASSFV